jgi:glutamate--cysteine ligase
VVDIALGGLARRARLDSEGRDERRFLEPLAALVAKGRCPADVTAEGIAVGDDVPVSEIVSRTAS